MWEKYMFTAFYLGFTKEHAAMGLMCPEVPSLPLN